MMSTLWRASRRRSLGPSPGMLWGVRCRALVQRLQALSYLLHQFGRGSGATGSILWLAGQAYPNLFLAAVGSATCFWLFRLPCEPAELGLLVFFVCTFLGSGTAGSGAFAGSGCCLLLSFATGSTVSANSPVLSLFRVSFSRSLRTTRPWPNLYRLRTAFLENLQAEPREGGSLLESVKSTTHLFLFRKSSFLNLFSLPSYRSQRRFSGPSALAGSICRTRISTCWLRHGVWM